MSVEQSLIHGLTIEPLWAITLGALIDLQASKYGERTALVFPWQKIRRTYNSLAARTKIIAKALLEAGLQNGECVGIVAGNCCEYVEVFAGAARIGCKTVVLNSNYTPAELLNAVVFSGEYLRYRVCEQEAQIDHEMQNVEDLRVVILDDEEYTQCNRTSTSYFQAFFARGRTSEISEAMLMQKQSKVYETDTLNLQFTSGCYAVAQVRMVRCRLRSPTLIHGTSNIINNARFTGDRLGFTENDVICCPPPLFHCYGLVLAFLGALTHGSAVVFPSQQFDPVMVLEAIELEECTVVYGVPTMYIAELDANLRKPRHIKSLRLALAGGAPVPAEVVKRLRMEMGIGSVLNAYGMTETSPTTFLTSDTDSFQQQLETVGTVLPHTSMKIVDTEGKTVLRGVAGEICTSGYALQQGYLKNAQKTQEAMRSDSNGVLWMHTGDEGILDSAGYLRVTGRMKDIIIREIEDRLLSHSSIVEAAVVGVPHVKYGEVVACFLRQAEHTLRPAAVDVADWVRQSLGRHKAPEHVWWIGDEHVGDDFPKTTSGKHQKHVLRNRGTDLISYDLRSKL
nr:putative acyl-coa synthetase yngi [Quercus suber]